MTIGLGAPGAHARAVQGHRHMIAAGHHAATQAGFAILEAGGNAVDAGVAAGIALGVVVPDVVNVAGVAPIMIRMADTGETVTIAGLGGWPKATRPEVFVRDHDGHIPDGLLRTVVPAAPEAWITALERYGTMTFGEVAAGAIRLAADGFPTSSMLANFITAHEAEYRRWPSSAAIFLKQGRPPKVGERFVQSDLAASLRYMADQERSVRGDRRAGLQAARDAFYRGDIASKIVRFHAENGGWLSADDLACFRTPVEAPVVTRFGDMEVYTCGVWCQGPLLAQVMRLQEADDLAALGHNSPAYIHLLTEAVKLACADRERWYGDPRFVEVPLQALLSEQYGALRRGLIDMARAAPDMPKPGDPRALRAEVPPLAAIDPTAAGPGPGRDTSYVCAVDRWGNVFSATPSDVSNDTPVIPGTGLCPSSRGCQSFAVPGHPSAPAPGKRPRLTPNPAMIRFGEDTFMPFGTPGGDVQVQAMVQVVNNLTVFGMDLQAAIDAPRFASYSFPSSFEPHDHHPGLLKLERLLPDATAEALTALGHRIEWWPERHWLAGGVCAVVADRASGLLLGAADPRRHGSAAGA
ncbi:MAG: gamma-glutamyltransferase family protein [Alphaproteobacteria bacterium]